MNTPLPAMAPRPHAALDLTPAPAILQALAHVGEVDLAAGLGRRRLAEVVRRTGPLEPPRPPLRRWLSILWLAAAVGCMVLLALG